uniref:Uncharacterized protein n=1 Tax=Arundo donax TaxID=35708 RepID=A0A0A9B9W3_ARUDO
MLKLTPSIGEHGISCNLQLKLCQRTCCN